MAVPAGPAPNIMMSYVMMLYRYSLLYRRLVCVLVGVFGGLVGVCISGAVGGLVGVFGGLVGVCISALYSLNIAGRTY